VLVSGTATSTVSSNGGNYGLDTGPGTFNIIANDFNGLVAPPPGSATVPVDGVGFLTLTLRPTGSEQALTNNDFETDMSSWTVSEGAAAGVSTLAAHTGNSSLLLSNLVTVSQSGAVSDMSRPLLSFWYKNKQPFTVEFLGDGALVGAGGTVPLQTHTLQPTADWTHFTAQLNTDGNYTGPIGVKFQNNSAAEIFIDEVSIAAGPYKTYLPVVFK
jgi:hypothetical protein